MKDKTENGMCETFSNHWLTIQPSLFNFIEDEVGELDEEQKLFVSSANGWKKFRTCHFRSCLSCVYYIIYIAEMQW